MKKQKWYLRDSVQLGMLIVVSALCVATAVILIWIKGIENGNRQIICANRALREQHAHDTDLSRLERAQLKLARNDKGRC